MKTRFSKFIILLAAFFIILGIVIFSFVWNGIIILNGFFANKYSVRGIDVSSYQGEINWKTLSDQNISFAFIKATEGSSFVDKDFAYNFEEA